MMNKTPTIASLIVGLLVGLSGAEGFSQNQNPDQQSQRRRQQQQPAGKRGQGNLQVGDLAPTFTLKSLDGETKTDLATYRDQKPVILYFGSYT
jgi:hypothetical protein